MSDRYQSYGYVREIDADKRRVTTVVSTGNIARDGMIIEQGGWKLDNYNRNPVILWAHNDKELPIGRAVSTVLVNGELVQTHEFANHPRAEEVWQAIRGGFVSATSVRWLGLDAGWEKRDTKDVFVFRSQELLETSYVPIPSDPGALIMRADGGVFAPPEPVPEPPAQPSYLERSACAVEAFARALKEGRHRD